MGSRIKPGLAERGKTHFHFLRLGVLREGIKNLKVVLSYSGFKVSLGYLHETLSKERKTGEGRKERRRERQKEKRSHGREVRDGGRRGESQLRTMFLSCNLST